MCKIPGGPRLCWEIAAMRIILLLGAGGIPLLSLQPSGPKIGPAVKIRLDHLPGPEFRAGGQTYLYFGGTAYLGLQQLPEFKALLAEATLRMGTHWGASRGGNVVVDVYAEAEQKLAAWTGSEAALTLSSGFLAGRLLAEFYARDPYSCFYSPSCHAALLPPGARRAAGWADLRSALLTFLKNHPDRQAVLFTDSLDFNNSPGPVNETLKTLPAESCLLVADDSHGLGVLGPRGNGAFSGLRALGFRKLLVCASLGKAMGVTAGVVLGPSEILKELEQTPLYSGASPAPPASVATLAQALDSGLYARQREKLLRNLSYFAERIGQVSGLQGIPGHPVWTFRDPSLAEGLYTRGILVTHFDYPAEGSTGSPSRIVLSAAHSEEQIGRLASQICDLRGLS